MLCASERTNYDPRWTIKSLIWFHGDRGVSHFPGLCFGGFPDRESSEGQQEVMHDFTKAEVADNMYN